MDKAICQGFYLLIQSRDAMTLVESTLSSTWPRLRPCDSASNAVVVERGLWQPLGLERS